MVEDRGPSRSGPYLEARLRQGHACTGPRPSQYGYRNAAFQNPALNLIQLQQAKNKKENGMSTKTTDGGFSAEERAAMKQRAEELRSTKGFKGAARIAKELEACVAAIDKLSGTDKEIAARVHTIVGDEAPQLNSKTYYGFPAYANADGKVIVFYQPASRFNTRYGTVTFNESANLDDGTMWPVSFAVLEVTDAVETHLRELVRRAVG
jgi:uncharacterized protein YdhG (YjbR/CyaY superfamily)